MNDGLLIAAALHCRGEIEDMPVLDVVERLRVAMRAAHDFWMTTDEEVRFRGAVGAVVSLASEEDKARIGRALEAVRVLGALVAGGDAAPALLDRLTELTSAEDFIPLRTLWVETRPKVTPADNTKAAAPDSAAA